MRVALLLTAEREAAAALARRVRAQHPDATVTAFVRDDDRAALLPDLAGWKVERDKPAGGKLAFLRRLRAQRFDLLVVAWHGGERFQPLRVAALLAGARRVVAVDERGVERRVAWHRPWTWAGHAVRRLSQLDAVALLRAGAWCYRVTVGALVFAVGAAAFGLFGPRLPRGGSR